MGGRIFSFGDFLDKKEKEMEELLKTNKEKWKAEYVLTRYNWFRYNIIQKHCEKALNKRIRIHQLRHSRRTYLYEYENVPIEKLRDFARKCKNMLNQETFVDMDMLVQLNNILKN